MHRHDTRATFLKCVTVITLQLDQSVAVRTVLLSPAITYMFQPKSACLCRIDLSRLQVLSMIEKHFAGI